MPYQKIPNIDLTYALITFDGDGHERTDDTEGGVFSKTLLSRVRETQPTHIFLFSHGWEGDVPAAVDQYNRWIGAMWNLTADRACMGSDFRPVFIGLHWPSRPWGEETSPASAPSFGTAADASIDALLEAAVQHFGGSQAVRPPLKVIFDAFEKDPTARVLPDNVVAAYHDLAGVLGFTAGAGPGASPDHDGAPLDPQAASSGRTSRQRWPVFRHRRRHQERHSCRPSPNFVLAHEAPGAHRRGRGHAPVRVAITADIASRCPSNGPQFRLHRGLFHSGRTGWQRHIDAARGIDCVGAGRSLPMVICGPIAGSPGSWLLPKCPTQGRGFRADYHHAVGE